MESRQTLRYLHPMKVIATVPGVHFDSRLSRASLLMEANNQEFLPIYDQYRPVGIITRSMVQERIRNYESFGSLDSLSVAHHMLTPVSIVSKHVTADQLLREYTTRRSKAFLFMEDGNIQGVLTLDGLLLALAINPEASIEPFVLKWKENEHKNG